MAAPADILVSVRLSAVRGKTRTVVSKTNFYLYVTERAGLNLKEIGASTVNTDLKMRSRR